MPAALRPVRLLLGALLVTAAAAVLVLLGSSSASADDGTPDRTAPDPLGQLVDGVGGTVDHTLDDTLAGVGELLTPPAPQPEPQPAPDPALQPAPDPASQQPAPQPAPQPVRPPIASTPSVPTTPTDPQEPRVPAAPAASEPAAPAASAPTEPRAAVPTTERQRATDRPDPAPRQQVDLDRAVPSQPTDDTVHDNGAGVVPIPAVGDLGVTDLPDDPWFAGRAPFRDTRRSSQHHTRPGTSPG